MDQLQCQSRFYAGQAGVGLREGHADLRGANVMATSPSAGVCRGICTLSQCSTLCVSIPSHPPKAGLSAFLPYRPIALNLQAE